jgi:hypothetical protein
MPTIIELTDEHSSSAHPDYAVLSQWLTENGVNLLWVRVPSEIRVERGHIETSEYAHEKDSVVMKGADPVVRRGTYAIKSALYLPALVATRTRTEP